MCLDDARPEISKTYRCSICGKEVRCSGALPDLYPFCSERCRLVDLGRWFNEQYSIDRDLTPEDIGKRANPPDVSTPDG